MEKSLNRKQLLKAGLNMSSTAVAFLGISRGEDLINQLYVPTTKMQRHMRKQTPRGDELVINCQRFNSNLNLSFSTKKNPSIEP